MRHTTLLLLGLALAACRHDSPPPLMAPATPPPTATPGFRITAPTIQLPAPSVAVTILPPSTPAPAPVELLPVVVPPPILAPILVDAVEEDPLTPEGRALLIEFEVGGRSGYDPHPEWPAGASGVTIGIGYDLRFNSRETFLRDWAALPRQDLARLVPAIGMSGQAAKARAAELRDITIPWSTAMDVFERTTVPKFDALSRRTYPGYDAIRTKSRNSLLSLTFNRGPCLVGVRRRHMVEIVRLCPKGDLHGMAQQERAMVVIWAGTAIEKGMRRRRLAEADLMEK